MPRVTMVRYATKPGRAAENEALSRAVYDELRKTAPDNISYALFKGDDTFVHLFVNRADDDSAALTELPSFKAFSADILDRCVTPPDVTRLSLDLIDSYGLK